MSKCPLPIYPCCLLWSCDVIPPLPQLPTMPLRVAGQQHTKEMCCRIQRLPGPVRHEAADLVLKESRVAREKKGQLMLE